MTISHDLFGRRGGGLTGLQYGPAAVKAALEADLMRQDCGPAVAALGKMNLREMQMRPPLSSPGFRFPFLWYTHRKNSKVKIQSSKLIINEWRKIANILTNPQAANEARTGDPADEAGTSILGSLRGRSCLL